MNVDRAWPVEQYVFALSLSHHINIAFVRRTVPSFSSLLSFFALGNRTSTHVHVHVRSCRGMWMNVHYCMHLLDRTLILDLHTYTSCSRSWDDGSIALITLPSFLFHILHVMTGEKRKYATKAHIYCTCDCSQTSWNIADNECNAIVLHFVSSIERLWKRLYMYST